MYNILTISSQVFMNIHNILTISSQVFMNIHNITMQIEEIL